MRTAGKCPQKRFSLSSSWNKACFRGNSIGLPRSLQSIDWLRPDRHLDRPHIRKCPGRPQRYNLKLYPQGRGNKGLKDSYPGGPLLEKNKYDTKLLAASRETKATRVYSYFSKGCWWLFTKASKSPLKSFMERRTNFVCLKVLPLPAGSKTSPPSYLVIAD